MKIVAISAGLSDASAATQLARAIAESTLAGATPEVGRRNTSGGEQNTTPPDVISLRAYARDIADAMTLGFPSEKLEALFQKVAGADAVVAVAPVYNAMPSGLFISFFNVLPEQTLAGKPVALGATGGTPRHSLVIEQAMRPMFIYLHALIPTAAVYAATEDWGAPGEGFDGTAGKSIANRVEREGRELRALLAMATGNPALIAAEHDASKDDDGEASWTVAALQLNKLQLSRVGLLTQAGRPRQLRHPRVQLVRSFLQVGDLSTVQRAPMKPQRLSSSRISSRLRIC